MLTALFISNNDTVPFLVPALLSAQGHYASCPGLEEGHWPHRSNSAETDSTAWRRLVPLGLWSARAQWLSV